jgi:hypothetical protein
MLGLEILDSQRIGNRVRVKPSPDVLYDDAHPFAQFTSAVNSNHLAVIKTVAVNDRIPQSLPKGKFNGEFLAGNAMRLFDQTSQSVD